MPTLQFRFANFHSECNFLFLTLNLNFVSSFVSFCEWKKDRKWKNFTENKRIESVQNTFQLKDFCNNKICTQIISPIRNASILFKFSLFS